jgi:hypothetical protein
VREDPVLSFWPHGRDRLLLRCCLSQLSLFFFEVTFMSQSTLQKESPGGSSLKMRLLFGSAAALRASQRWAHALDNILRGEATRPSVLREESLRIPLIGLSTLILGLAMFYGLCMGMYPGCRTEDPSALRWLACTVKIPALFALTLCVTFPSLYVVNALAGSRLRLMAILKLLVAALAVNLAVLASAGPIVAFFSFSTTNCSFMVLLNVMAFTVAGLLGMIFLLQTLNRMSRIPTAEWLEATRRATPRPCEDANVSFSERWARESDPFLRDGPGAITRDTGPLISDPVPDGPDEPEAPAAASPADVVIPEREGHSCAFDHVEGLVLSRHVKIIFCCWAVIFAVVGAQMAWVLRPYFGNPGEPFVWFGPRTSNFFEGVWMALRELLS